MNGVRLDKWLWAARFFKTRALAKSAVESGKVKLNGARSKPSKLLISGETLSIRQSWEEKIVTVLALSEQRRSAPEAAQLYRETEASIAAREERAAARKALADTSPVPSQRPSKKQRRQIHRFKLDQTP